MSLFPCHILQPFSQNVSTFTLPIKQEAWAWSSPIGSVQTAWLTKHHHFHASDSFQTFTQYCLWASVTESCTCLPQGKNTKVKPHHTNKERTEPRQVHCTKLARNPSPRDSILHFFFLHLSVTSTMQSTFRLLNVLQNCNIFGHYSNLMATV